MITITSIINEPQTIDSVALPAFKTQKRASATAAVIAAAAARTLYYNELKGDPQAQPNVTEYEFVQATGTTVALPDDTRVARFRHAADIAALTVQMPVKPLDGQVVTLVFAQAVTALTMASGVGASQTLVGAATAAADAGFMSYQYEKAANTWYRIA